MASVELCFVFPCVSHPEAREKMEREAGPEPATSTLERLHSTN